MSTDTPRPENPELLAAIIAHPDEDTPRLMYADWLQENGDLERAEFIRLHIEWDRRPPYAPPDGDLKRRLIAAWEAAGLKKRGGIYQRGFDSVTRFDRITAFCERAASAFRSAPIRMMYLDQWNNLEDFPDWREQLHAALPIAQGVTGIGARDSQRDLGEIGEELLKLPQASALRVIDLGPSASTWQCRCIAEAKHLTNLLVIDCNGSWEMDRACVGLLAGAAHLQSLVALRLGEDDDSDGYIGPDEIRALTNAPCFTNLRQLVLNGHYPFDDEALRRLLAWDRVGQLEVLEFFSTQVGPDGLRELCRCPKLTNLRRLVVNGYDLEPAAFAHLLDSPYLVGLRELRISRWGEPLPEALTARLVARFGSFSLNDMRDPTPVCVEDLIRRRYRLMDGSGFNYGGRPSSRDNKDRIIQPEYAIL